MGQLWFFIKTFLLSLIIVIILQIHIGSRTLEQQTVSFASQAFLYLPIQSVADDAATAIHRTWDRITNHIKSQRWHAGAREQKFQLERHPDAIKSN